LKKNLPLVILIGVVALVVGCYLGFSSFSKDKTVAVNRDLTVPPANTNKKDSISVNQVYGDPVKKDLPKENDIPSAEPKKGETVVWGEVKAVDVDKRVLTIDQQMDDNSVKIGPNVPVDKDAVVRTKDKVITLSQVKLGDSVGIIVTKEGQGRAVLVNY
jgi:hypothetical protein